MDTRPNPPAADTLDLHASIDEYGPVLGHYVNIACILADMMSPVLETVVHDLSDLDHSIIAIFNGHLTGRHVGDPATDVVRRLVDGELPDVIVGYDNESPNGQRLKSSSLAIYDADEALIGVLGLNMDISYFQQFGKFIDRFIATHRSEHVPQSEHFRHIVPNGMQSPREDIRDAIDQYRISQNWNTRVLNNDEKRAIVEHLYRQGYFKTRGAATIIANLLGLTRPSVYNYKNAYIEQQQNEQDAID
jgi:predicted transcriptional regulator YheO